MAKCAPTVARDAFVSTAFTRDHSRVLQHFLKNTWYSPDLQPKEKEYGSRLAFKLRHLLLGAFCGRHETAKSKANTEARKKKAVAERQARRDAPEAAKGPVDDEVQVVLHRDDPKFKAPAARSGQSSKKRARDSPATPTTSPASKKPHNEAIELEKKSGSTPD